MTAESKSALVIDDSQTMRKFVVQALEERGFEVTTATSGFEALKILAQDRAFNVIVTDVNMPTINGLEVVRSVRKNPSRASTPIIIISTDGAEKDRERGMNLGANAYVTKPFTPEALLEVVEREMAKAGSGASS
jgi:two-component system chemotaxis response regulator CheY